MCDCITGMVYSSNLRLGGQDNYNIIIIMFTNFKMFYIIKNACCHISK